MKRETVYLGIGLLLMLSLGFILGMLFQQAMVQATLMKVAGNMEGVNVEISFNETKLVEGITDFYRPYFEKSLEKGI